ncbi:RNA exonuclease 4 [Cephus cinctus]|uniref:RNA exonuclease 4 n=1 Tax=Cephus cinctus TaxID=211228 RepID=A0AAJ7RL77_CEPCN|nr:RNA exonuclease 4 [Cephus cinctus]XP_015599560.1 RNA exonuclease 4 [Cephus cinctus]XP_015599561.1 RNA exonuclease 4 [Cephus cinctus]XP_024942943.1 RNA exonuclease 4 [Cephus cinctus]
MRKMKDHPRNCSVSKIEGHSVNPTKRIKPVDNSKEPADTLKKKKKEHAPVIEVKRCASGSNWEKFKDLVSQEASSEKCVKPKPSRQSKSLAVSKQTLRNMGQPNLYATYPSATSSEAKVNETKDQAKNMITKQIAMDCEMVGIGDGTESMIARVSIVNRHGVCLYDKYVKPRERIKDYRTEVSGIRPHHLATGEEFAVVQKEVSEILKGKILIGHAIKNDLDVLYLSHPKRSLRDTSKYKPFRKVSMGNTPSLKKLALELLGIEIQTGEHNSVEDARAAMQLYMIYKNQWEMEIYSRR